ncbi:MAG: phenylalanine--tRNA ligase subunit beta [Minisyncoccota bacterium]
MKISRKWLQTYFDQALPEMEEIDHALTFHAFEIEGRGEDVIDVKILPNRAADCLCHRGVAKELGAILSMPVSRDPLRESLPVFATTHELSVDIEDEEKCLRYMGALVKGVRVGPSPQWLVEALEAVGQRSINNVVDATNFVMLDVGQPLHAFDAKKLSRKNNAYSIAVRAARIGEEIVTLSGDTHIFSEDAVVIADDNANAVLGIAGIKGGRRAEIDDKTIDIVVEAAHFDGPTIRRASQKLKLFTEASLRFQNRPSPELVAYGMRDVLALIQKIAGGQIVGVVDSTDGKPARPTAAPVSTTLNRINEVLGAQVSKKEVEDVFKRLDFELSVHDDVFMVTPPFERRDIMIPEDVIEEVGRIVGYENLESRALPPSTTVADHARYQGIERMKDMLVEQGFTEVSTQSFSASGDIVLANPLDKTKPTLRTTLAENLDTALTQAKKYAPLLLGQNHEPKLFEVGTVFLKEGEHIELRMTERVVEWGESAGTVDNLSVANLEEYGKEYVPKRYKLDAYRPFSVYPFIVRDVAVFVPAQVSEEEVARVIRSAAGGLVARGPELFDRFEKKNKETGVVEKISYAFRIVFQSMTRTLTDQDANEAMTRIKNALENQSDWNVR